MCLILGVNFHVRQLREDLGKERERHDNTKRVFSEKMDMERKKVQEACREEVSGLVKQVLLEFCRKFIC